MNKKSLRLRAHRERGVVLLFALIILVIMLAGGVAVMRSMNTSLFGAGNLAFRRDLMNQGEQAVSTVMTQFAVGGVLATGTIADSTANNYKASTLPTNPQGIPTALLGDSAFALVGTTANDLTGATNDVKIRYVIDRLCSAAGVSSTTTCVQSAASPPGGTASPTPPPAPPTATVYRLSMRVTGPRDTQVFMQTTITKPD